MIPSSPIAVPKVSRHIPSICSRSLVTMLMPLQSSFRYGHICPPPLPRTNVHAVQNTTFGGIQGFTEPPATPWYADDGSFAGIVHQERNWTYLLFKDAGHLVALDQPAHAHTFLREFVLGDNQTGLVTTRDGRATVVGGAVSSLAVGVLPGQSGIFIGSGATQSTYTFPSATIAAWDSYIVTATATEAVGSASAPIVRARPTPVLPFRPFGGL